MYVGETMQRRFEDVVFDSCYTHLDSSRWANVVAELGFEMTETKTEVVNNYSMSYRDDVMQVWRDKYGKPVIWNLKYDEAAYGLRGWYVDERLNQVVCLGYNPSFEVSPETLKHVLDICDDDLEKVKAVVASAYEGMGRGPAENVEKVYKKWLTAS